MVRRPEVLGVRPVDDGHEVVSVASDGSRYRLEPCRECPWRVDKVGGFPAEAFVQSARVAEELATSTFGCHMTGTARPATCAGFLVAGADHNLAAGSPPGSSTWTRSATAGTTCTPATGRWPRPTASRPPTRPWPAAGPATEKPGSHEHPAARRPSRTGGAAASPPGSEASSDCDLDVDAEEPDRIRQDLAGHLQAAGDGRTLHLPGAEVWVGRNKRHMDTGPEPEFVDWPTLIELYPSTTQPAGPAAAGSTTAAAGQPDAASLPAEVDLVPLITAVMERLRRKGNRVAAEAELHTLPEGKDPSVTFEAAAAAAAGERASGDEAQRVARQSGLLLHAEPWTGHIMLHEGGWQMTVDRRARPYAGVEDLATYWRLRERQPATPTTVREQPAAGTAAPDGGGRVLQLRRRWVLGQQLRSGGFGAVFVATGEDGTSAAAKFVPKVAGAERELLFARLDGVRNVVPVIDSGEAGDEWILVMPRAERSLQDRLQEIAEPLPLDDALVVLRDVATALADLAARGEPVVHRDIKPGNVLLLDGAWCLADFGISRYAEASTAPDTRKHSMTPPYAAPEQWRIERATARTDVYAVGVMAFELLTGTHPFPGPDVEDFREQHLHHEPPPLAGAAPSWLAALIAECLQKAPEARPTPESLLARLERVRGGELGTGASNLAAAYHRQVGHAAAEGAAASRARSEQRRRAELAMAASRSLYAIAEQLLSVVLDLASVQVQRRPEMHWIVELASTKFGLSAPTLFDGHTWGGWDRPPFDVVASATVTVVIPADRHGYEGRSHALYYCDAHQEGSYAWFETAFMASPLTPSHSAQDPFALAPGEAAAKAFWPGLAEYQVAWPVTELVMGELEEFIDRWVGWFAAGAEGRLAHPSRMPERPVDGTWRRR